MKLLKITSLMYFLTPVIGAIAYVSAVVIFEGGKELGEVMWRGFFIQICLLSSYGLIVGLIFLIPIIILIERKIIDKNKKILIYGVTIILFLTATYTLYAGASPLTGILISIVPALIIVFIKYQLMCKEENT